MCLFTYLERNNILGDSFVYGYLDDVALVAWEGGESAQANLLLVK